MVWFEVYLALSDYYRLLPFVVLELWGAAVQTPLKSAPSFNFWSVKIHNLLSSIPHVVMVVTGEGNSS